MSARAVLPINYSGSRPEANSKGELVPETSGFKFGQLTLSHLSVGSNLYWLHFVFVYVFVFWVMWLLIKYYQACTPRHSKPWPVAVIAAVPHARLPSVLAAPCFPGSVAAYQY